jgi:hypothetical protein
MIKFEDLECGRDIYFDNKKMIIEGYSIRIEAGEKPLMSISFVDDYKQEDYDFNEIKHRLSFEKKNTPTKYYQAYYKDPDNYTLEVPSSYFKCVKDFKCFLGASYKPYELDDMVYGLTDTYIEIQESGND